jgi:metal transporter CNNM
MNYLIILFLISLSGLFSGLTLGLLGLNKTDLERKIKLGNKKAIKVYEVRKKGNLLLCTLLLGNVAVNSTLAIFLGSIASGVIAGLVATVLIVIFGEILPQAICARFALEIGSKTIWLVKIFIFILFPICWPLAWLLNKMLGKEITTIWSRKELKEIIKLHEDSPNSKLDRDEERIVLGALSFSDKIAKNVMTPRTVIFALEYNDILDSSVLQKIKKHGFTRIPIYKDTIDKIVGILYVKDLIDIKKNTKVKDIYRKNNLIIITEDQKLDQLFNNFIKKKDHIAFVFDNYGGLEGIVTLEDVIEEVIGQEIVDESDLVVNMREKAKTR